MAKIAHKILKKCAIFHIIIFSDITTVLNIVSHMGFKPTLRSRVQSSMERVVTPGGDLLDDLLNDLMTPLSWYPGDYSIHYNIRLVTNSAGSKMALDP